MGRAVTRAIKPSRAPRATAAPERATWLTQAAFVLTLALVIARATMLETVRTESLGAPGTAGAPVGPGPAAGLVLDLLCCLPALCVLARRVVDRNYILRLSWSHLLLALLASWTLASVAWSADKFAAAVSAAHWAAALVLLWSTSQLVQSWLRLRVLAGVAFALLLVLVAQGYYYRFLDLPDLQRRWHDSHDELLRDAGLEANSREAIQMGKNIETGEVSGFTVSRNSFAAELVLLGVITAGIALQRRYDRDPVWWGVPLWITIALALVLLYRYVQSKTAYITPLLAVILLSSVWRWRAWLAQHANAAYAGGVAVFFLGVAAVVGHGLKHGTLVHSSLTFRWQYWVGAARLYAHHPLLGVGWANFGANYLAFRLPAAPEEPKDPHNYLVRAFVELGAVGGTLMLLWMLRLWWECTRPATPIGPLDESARQSSYGPRTTIPFITLIALGGVVISTMASTDWNATPAWIFLELFRRGAFLLLLIGGIGVACIRGLGRQELDDRPAPWILYAMLVALGLFLLHNLIDFSMFEVGPMFLLALSAGGALGVRLPPRQRMRHGTVLAAGALIIASIGWLVAAGAFVAPVVGAEAFAADADTAFRRGNPNAAAQQLWDAFQKVPINGDYAFRAAVAARAAQSSPLIVRQMLQSATAADPSAGKYWTALAAYSILTFSGFFFCRALWLEPPKEVFGRSYRLY